ncbi:PLP-dependent lyase/thiolase [Candidatus Parcubacteria bacterium]|nr:PLP-dependent lyase/thiolase [Candidatus Parcubacteria bacterium]
MLTPQTEEKALAQALGVPKLYLKREDLHPYGSHKGRSIPMMIDIKVADGAKDFAISSSGNAALAAARHIQKKNSEGHDLTLAILAGEHMNEEKKRALKNEITDERITIEETPRPLQALFRLIKGGGKESLRQSTDDDALLGYQSLAHEIAATPELSAVFIGTSSGTTAQALADHFAEHGVHAQIHVVQTAGTSPIAREFKAEESEPETSLADAIVDRVAHRKDTVVKAVEKTGGAGWIASNDDIRRAQSLLQEKACVDATPNGALGLAGLIRALKKGARFSGAVVCVITGK